MTLPEWNGEGSLTAFVVSLNLHRRHLDESQRSLVAARIATMQQGARTDLSPIDGMSQRQAADLLNVGSRSVERAKKVLDEGTPELLAAVEQGSVAVSMASEIATLPTAEQQAVLEEGDAAILRKAKVAAFNNISLTLSSIDPRYHILRTVR